MNRQLLLIIFCSLALKAVLTFGIVKSFHFSWDEESAWSVAENKNEGHDYSLFYPGSNEYRKTAFHGSFTVILYDFLIQHHIDKQAWAGFIHALTFILFAVSVYYFYLLSSLFIENKKWRMACTATYAFYPSVIYYIGALLVYENPASSLLIICIYRIARASRCGFGKSDFFILPAVIAVSCLFRPQLIVIYSVILILNLLILSQKKSVFIICVLSLALTMTGFIPTLQKNKKLFGSYMLGTQRSFEILQGHNPVARGSWMHHWEDAGNPLYEYAHAHIPGLESMNEHEAAQARKRLALDWAIQNPGKEIVLTFRKTAIYFLPYNFEELPQRWYLNIFTLIVHLAFLCGIFYSLIRKHVDKHTLILYFPVIASVLLTLIFYVGYRWRYYAEPFMILLGWIFIVRLFNRSRLTEKR